MNGFPKGARVCFLGDSITHNNGFLSRIVDYYHTNLKDRGVNFYNCGVSGGNLRTLLNIFDEDVAIRNPTHAVIMIGMNDSARYFLQDLPRCKERYDKLLNAYETYKVRLSTICDKLEAIGAEIIMCTPTPYDEYQDSATYAYKGGFALLAAYAEYVRSFAKERGYKLCDYHTYISKVAQYEPIISPDRVHPNVDGHYHIAKCFLEFQGFDIGENKPIPEYLSEWRTKVEKIRTIHATEDMVVQDYTLSTEERIEKIKKYLENPPASPYIETFVAYSKRYLEDKPNQKQLMADIDRLMEVEFKK